MKEYVDVTHVSSDISKMFEKKLNKVIEEYQNEGYVVEIQYASNGNIFSAVVLAYLKRG